MSRSGMEDLAKSRAAPEASVSRAGKKLVLKLKGDWTVRHGEHHRIQHIFSDLDRQSGASELDFDMSNIDSWDTSLLIVVTRVEEWCKAHNVSFGRDSLLPGVKSLIALSEEVPERKTGRGEIKPVSFFGMVGNATISAFLGVNSALAFLGEAVLSFGRIITGKAAFDWRMFWLTMEECSSQALPIV